MNNVKELIAKDLLKIKAVFFRPDEPFTWASGIKSPVYCDNRLTLTAVGVRNDVENSLADAIRNNYLYRRGRSCPHGKIHLYKAVHGAVRYTEH